MSTPMIEIPEIRVSLGADYGDTGKGAQNQRMLYDMLTAMGIYGDEAYANRLLDDPWHVLAEERVLFNIAPFGGHNAGNNVYLLDSGQKVKTHALTPGSLFAPYVISLMGKEKNIHLGKLEAERTAIVEHGPEIIYGKTIFFDRYATVTTEQDIALDRAGSKHLRGTLTGNGPAMMGRTIRTGPRFEDLFHLDDPETATRLTKDIVIKNYILEGYKRDGVLGIQTFEPAEIFSALKDWAEMIGREAVVNGKEMIDLVRGNPEGRIFINATQGQNLDNATGSVGKCLAYNVDPHSVLGGCYLPIDIAPPFSITKKAYVTRAGSGLFPGEFDETRKEFLAGVGQEIGVTSGNIRRSGRDNLAETKYLVSLISDNGIEVSQNIVKVDVFGEFMERFGPQNPIIGYRLENGSETNHVSFPYDGFKLILGDNYFWGKLSEGQIHKMVEKGWPAFPSGLQEYLIYAAKFTGAPVAAVGLGPKFGDTATRGVWEETRQVV